MKGSGSSTQTPVRRRILIVDKHSLLRRGLRSLIDNEPGLIVCAEAATRQEALEAIASSTPDLVIADPSLEDGDGLDLVKDIRAQDGNLPILVLAMHDAPLYAERALRAGAGGYVLKQEMSETVLLAIRCVLGGEQYVSPQIGISFQRGPLPL